MDTSSVDLTKKELRVLETMFAQEVNAAVTHTRWMPYQSKAKVMAKLEAGGYIEQCTETLPGWPPVTIKGYRLTVLGHASYCFSTDE